MEYVSQIVRWFRHETNRQAKVSNDKPHVSELYSGLTVEADTPLVKTGKLQETQSLKK